MGGGQSQERVVGIEEGPEVEGGPQIIVHVKGWCALCGISVKLCLACSCMYFHHFLYKPNIICSITLEFCKYGNQTW